MKAYGGGGRRGIAPVILNHGNRRIYEIYFYHVDAVYIGMIQAGNMERRQGMSDTLGGGGGFVRQSRSLKGNHPRRLYTAGRIILKCSFEKCRF
jgi:hypothetical protein